MFYRKVLSFGLFISSAFFLVSSSVFAQGTPLPPLENVKLFVGYSLIPGTSDVQEPIFGPYGYEQKTRHGWKVGLSGDVKNWIGIGFEASGHYAPVEATFGGIDFLPMTRRRVGDVSHYTFLGGPTVTLKTERAIRPFAHALVGLSHYRASIDPEYRPLNSEGQSTQNSFAYGGGAGVDWKARGRVSVRLFQVDYLRFAGIPEPRFYDYRKPGQVRMSFGVVFGF